MKVFSVFGLTGSGKTTTIENIIKELVSRGFTVGSVKEIHFDAFQIDTEGKNTWRHRQAGADTVSALAMAETDVMYRGKMDIYDLLKHYNQDFVVLEGVRNIVAPNIVVARESDHPEINDLSIAISGVYSASHKGDVCGVPIINSMTDVKALCDLIEAKVPELMPKVDEKCCGLCGGNCRQFLAKYLKGETKICDCALHNADISLKIGGEEIVMVPFVRKLLKNAILGVVSELKGYKKSEQIKVEFIDK